MNWGELSAAAGVGALLFTGATWYHDSDIEPIETSIVNIETAAVAQRLGNLFKYKCSPGATFGPELEQILQEQIQRYFELTGREYDQPC